MPGHLWKVAGLLLVTASVGHGQRSVILSGGPACGSCRIELERIAAFGDAAGPGMLQEQSTVATDSRRRFYAVSNHDPTIAVFDSAGSYLRKVGREGPGPGEFTGRPTLIFTADDTLYAIEPLRRRLTVFSPTYTFVRIVNLSHEAAHAAATRDGRLLLTGRERGLTGTTILHLVAPTGAHIRSFPAPKAEGRWSPVENTRQLAEPRGEALWAAQVDAYVLEHWGLDGKQLAKLVRQVEWFAPKVWGGRGVGPWQQPPEPRMANVAEDGAGLVWTLSHVADANWKPHELPRRQSGSGARYIPDSLRHELYDSVIEVIDPERGVVLASRRFDTRFMQFIAPSLLVAFDEDPDGNPRYVVWRTRLVSGTG